MRSRRWKAATGLSPSSGWTLACCIRHLEKLEEGYSQLIVREDAIKMELAKKEDYDEIIETIRKRLQTIDEKLEVNKK